jgi:alanine racemase
MNNPLAPASGSPGTSGDGGLAGWTPPAVEAPAGVTGLITVDLQAIVENWRQMAFRVGPGCMTGAAVKADAYGLGVIPVAGALAAAGCRWFFVATPDEGVTLAQSLAKSAPDARVAVLSGPIPGTARELAAYANLIPVLNDIGQISAWHAAAPGRAAILQLDTGMARLGLPPEEIDRLAADPSLLGGMPVAAVISHLACADEPDHPLNAIQLASFTAAAARLPAAPRSLAASSGIFLGAGYHFDLVRPGAALYGLNPTPSQTSPMRQVVGIKAKILQVREIDAGRTVGYGATYAADRPRRVATLGVGYADGVLRAGSNAARVFLGPVAIPVIGRISMDLVTVDVSAVPPQWVLPGGFVDVLGPQYGADDLARDCGTIGYEVLTRLSRRLLRLYGPVAA